MASKIKALKVLKLSFKTPNKMTDWFLLAFIHVTELILKIPCTAVMHLIKHFIVKALLSQNAFATFFSFTSTFSFEYTGYLVCHILSHATVAKH